MNIKILALGLSLVGGAFADSVIYINPTDVGNQSFGQGLRMDFDVSQSITVTRLGAFDSGQDGFVGTITVDLYNRSGTPTILASETFTGNAGALIGGSRFLSLLLPLVLPSGFHGSIVAHGFGSSDLNGNVGCNPNPLAICGVNNVQANPTTDNLGGAIAFVGGGYFDGAGFPTTPDSGPANRYEAGTFAASLTPTPEPAGWVLASLASALFAAFRLFGMSGNRRRSSERASTSAS